MSAQNDSISPFLNKRSRSSRPGERSYVGEGRPFPNDLRENLALCKSAQGISAQLSTVRRVRYGIAQVKLELVALRAPKTCGERRTYGGSCCLLSPPYLHCSRSIHIVFRGVVCLVLAGCGLKLLSFHKVLFSLSSDYTVIFKGLMMDAICMRVGSSLQAV